MLIKGMTVNYTGTALLEDKDADAIITEIGSSSVKLYFPGSGARLSCSKTDVEPQFMLKEEMFQGRGVLYKGKKYLIMGFLLSQSNSDDIIVELFSSTGSIQVPASELELIGRNEVNIMIRKAEDSGEVNSSFKSEYKSKKLLVGMEVVYDCEAFPEDAGKHAFITGIKGKVLEILFANERSYQLCEAKDIDPVHVNFIDEFFKGRKAIYNDDECMILSSKQSAFDKNDVMVDIAKYGQSKTVPGSCLRFVVPEKECDPGMPRPKDHQPKAKALKLFLVEKKYLPKGKRRKQFVVVDLLTKEPDTTMMSASVAANFCEANGIPWRVAPSLQEKLKFTDSDTRKLVEKARAKFTNTRNPSVGSEIAIAVDKFIDLQSQQLDKDRVYFEIVEANYAWKAKYDVVASFALCNDMDEIISEVSLELIVDTKEAKVTSVKQVYPPLEDGGENFTSYDDPDKSTLIRAFFLALAGGEG